MRVHLLHAKGEPDVSKPDNGSSINVRFATQSQVRLPIKYLMKNSTSILKATAANESASNQSSRSNRGRKSSKAVRIESKEIKFLLEAPSARSVKLAADFTDWEKSPLELSKTEEGIWFTTVALSPGQYAYRFIVDGNWQDDPYSLQRVPNPFGTTNAMISIF